MALSKKQKNKPHQAKAQKTDVVNHDTGRNKVVAALLAFFLGDLGIHKFYLGQNKAGVIYLFLTVVFSWTVIIPVIITIICWIEAIGYIATEDNFIKKYK